MPFFHPHPIWVRSRSDVFADRCLETLRLLNKYFQPHLCGCGSASRLPAVFNGRGCNLTIRLSSLLQGLTTVGAIPWKEIIEYARQLVSYLWQVGRGGTLDLILENIQIRAYEKAAVDLLDICVSG